MTYRTIVLLTLLFLWPISTASPQPAQSVKNLANMTIDEAEAAAAKDLIRQAPPNATNPGRVVNNPLDSSQVLAEELPSVARDALSATESLLGKVNSFLERF